MGKAQQKMERAEKLFTLFTRFTDDFVTQHPSTNCEIVSETSLLRLSVENLAVLDIFVRELSNSGSVVNIVHYLVQETHIGEPFIAHECALFDAYTDKPVQMKCPEEGFWPVAPHLLPEGDAELYHLQGDRLPALDANGHICFFRNRNDPNSFSNGFGSGTDLGN